MDLQQYYTDAIYCDSLINNLESKNPREALDVGFGAGGLLYAAKRRWNDINLIGIDIDPKNILEAKNLNLINTIEQNGLSLDLPNFLGERYGDIDLLISNPPYYAVDLDLGKKIILKKAKLDDCISKTQKKVPAELLFLAQNLRLLTNTGEIGIVLPSGLISGKRWQAFREQLFSQYCVSKVIQLPTDSFKETDAQTFILIISKLRESQNKTIKISHVLDDNGYEITYEQAIERADYQYYKRLENNIIYNHGLTREDFCVFRGNLSHYYLKENFEFFVHTTNLPKSPDFLNLPNYPINGAVNAKQGDILLARVGRRCLGRVAQVRNGEIPISDCVICVRANNQRARKTIWRLLRSHDSSNFFKETSFGVSAKYITHELVVGYLLGD